MADEKSNETKEPSGLADVIISRRKLAYIAPMFVSRKLIYRAVGCAKVDPRIRTCGSSGVSGS